MLKIRDYQEEAISKLKDNNWTGIFEMATGTGKTITSLLAASEYNNTFGRIFLIILVPFTHLIGQWEDNCEMMGFFNISKCFGRKVSWLDELNYKIRDFNIGISNVEVVLVTYKTASSIDFNERVKEIRSNTFIIGDECHYFGIKSLRNHKFNSFHGRLALSATPDRWWDEKGTEFLRNYFGETIYRYDMKKAIENGILTEYKYIPIVVDLTQQEIIRYEKLTKILVSLLIDKKINKDEIEEINRKRSMIISKAENKKNILLDILRKKEIKTVSHTLVYCAPGEVNQITIELSHMGYKVHRFDSNVSLKEREKLIKLFSDGKIQILVAIKCLDEGIDIPSTKEAYFLASTSNPREFIQRRGRVLRKSFGKNLAEIYDFIVLPNNMSNNLVKSIVSKELPRFAEFSQYAINEYEARLKISPYLSIFALEYLMDKLPWEVYEEMCQYREEM